MSLISRIEDLHAFIAIDDEGREGIVAFRDGAIWKPMVTADYDRLQTLRKQARAIAKYAGRRIRIVKFTRCADVELIEAGH